MEMTTDNLRVDFAHMETSSSDASLANYDDDEKPSSLNDPYCNPKSPRRIKFSDISTAAFNIRDGIVLTPSTKSHQLSDVLGVDLFFKKEFLQTTGSFKERGARYAIMRLKPEEREKGVIAASAGNHALALAYHGQQLGVKTVVVMPTFAPLMKISSCRSYGAEVILKGKNIQEARVYAMQLSQERGLKYINGFDHPDIIAGQGTIGLEILEQIKNIDAVIVPVGGGGLIAGIALAVKTLKPEVQIIGVESEACASFQNSLKGTDHPIFAESSLADGLAVPTVGVNAVFMARGIIDELITVCEESIALAILRLLEMEKSVVEGAGAVGLAALLSGKVASFERKAVSVVVNILTGGNIDSTVLGRTIERGLAVDGRLVKFDIVVSDRPGGIAELATRISETGASIKDIFHERAWLAANVFEVRVRIVVETRDREHADELYHKLSEKYTSVTAYDKRPGFMVTN
ncbi:Threonine ammonia-lyase [Aphelenchoides bicaudatus]|nr:Threonine ammonia-lyase [Aphelenchoides bicaudatus]